MASKTQVLFEKVVRTQAYATIIDEAIAMSRITACAGIRRFKNDEMRIKAKVNYYGAPSARIPARRWLDPAVAMTDDVSQRVATMYMRALKRAIRENLRGGPLQKAKYSPKGDIQSGYDTERQAASVHPALSSQYGVGPTTIMKDLANAMRDNILEYIYSERSQPNRERTLRRKWRRSTTPLIDYGEFVKEIKAWTENEGGSRKSTSSYKF